MRQTRLGQTRDVGCTAGKVLLTLPASFTIRLSDLAMVDSWMLSLAVPSAKACLSNAGRPCVYKMLIQGSPLVHNLERAVLNLDGVEIVVAKNAQKKRDSKMKMWVHPYTWSDYH